MSKRSGPNTKYLPKGLGILHEDRDILVVNKPAGLLTVSTDTERERTVYFSLTDYVRKGSARSRKRIFVVHRLDRGTSGVLIFAKTAEAKVALQERWPETRKKYLALVHGRCEKRAETIESYLAENQARMVYSTGNPKKGRLARTAYKVIKTADDHTLLEVDLLTGRKNQIRVHLAGIGHPVVGDRKYGKGNKSDKRLALHAHSISFRHPFSGQPCVFEAPAPGYFYKLVGKLN